MSKLPITTQIEQALCKRFQGTSTRYATEIGITYVDGSQVKYGIVDFVTAKYNYELQRPDIGCYEIKISYADMKSEHGHTLVGDDNFYVMTSELYDEIIGKNPNLIMNHAGIIVFNDGKLRGVREQNKRLPKLVSIESRFKVLDQMLMRWQNGRNTLEENALQ